MSVIRGSKWLAAGLFACHAFGGCVAGAPEDPDAVTSALDEGAFNMAIRNQERIEARGFRLVGRAWLAPDTYAEMYEPADTIADDEVAQSVPRGGVMMFSGHSTGELASRTDLHPMEQETFQDYIARVAPTEGIRFDLQAGTVDPEGADVLLFDPSQLPVQTAQAGVSVEAVTNQYCPLESFEARCSRTWGYGGSSPVITSRLHDLNSKTSSATGTSVYTVVCADRNDMTVTINGNSSLWMEFDVSEGRYTWAGSWTGWSNYEFCASYFLGICLDNQWRTVYNPIVFEVVTRSAHTNGNHHVCTKIRTNRNTTAEYSCGDLAACPADPTFL